jgi:phospholipase/carboxylesterase
MSAPDILPCVEVEPRGGGLAVTSSVIWLHGLGADGHDFEPIVPYLGLDQDHGGVRFVFPHAPKRPVALNMGVIMRAWYDIRAIDLRRDHDVEGIADSAGRIRALIARENARGIPTNRVVLAGFSQGGAMALYVGLRHPEKLGGILALSCYSILEDSLSTEASDANRGTKIFQAHGEWDPMVPLERGRASHDRLIQLGYDVEWRTYPMGHEVHPREIQDIGAWLRERLTAG